HVPAVAVEAGRLVDRQPAEVARFLAGDTVWLILVVAAGPLADEADLRRRGRLHDEHGARRQDDCTYHVSATPSPRHGGRAPLDISNGPYRNECSTFSRQAIG